MDLDHARTLFPLVTPEALRTLARLRQHPCAPRWTHEVGDHVRAEDLDAVERFRASLERPVFSGRRAPPAELCAWVEALRPRVPHLRALPAGLPLERDWAYLPTLRREDLASRPEALVPEDADLARLIVYETSGTTGHAVRVPHHPLAVAQLHVLAERALAWHGVRLRTGPEAVAAVNLRAQASVWVYASLFSVWGGAGFARVNLHDAAWAGGREAARAFLADLRPSLLCGDPDAFSELSRWGVEPRPDALLSTATALSPRLRAALAERHGCPVLDWYSTTETGPIACSRPGGDGLAVLAPDLYVELVDEDGLPVPEGARGEVCVTGGRNPYLPLLRYRTGDFARGVWGVDAEGRSELRLHDLEGRAPVSFRTADGAPVNAVDIGRALRHHFAVVQHAFVQRADGSCEATLRPAHGLPLDVGQVERELVRLFGPGTRVEVRVDEELGRAGKVVPYRSEREVVA